MDIGQKLRDLAVSESGFVFDPYSGASFNTNATGYFILQRLKEGLGREEVIAELHEAFDTDEADLDRDLDDFIFMLRENGVLPADFNL